MRGNTIIKLYKTIKWCPTTDIINYITHLKKQLILAII